MESSDNNKLPKTAQSAHYDVENPQKLNLPMYNSTTEKRDSSKLPHTENLNNDGESISNFSFRKKDRTSIPDETAHGEGGKIDLGNGELDDPENEKIIRT